MMNIVIILGLRNINLVRQNGGRSTTFCIYIIEPFYRFTTVLLKTKEITVYYIFGIYNALFEHFEESII